MMVDPATFNHHDPPVYYPGMFFGGSKQIERITPDGYLLLNGREGCYNSRWVTLADTKGIDRIAAIENRLATLEKVIGDLIGACDEDR